MGPRPASSSRVQLLIVKSSEHIFVPTRLPSDVSLVVYTEGARSEAGWDFLLEKYLLSISPSEKSTIKAALSYSPLTHKLQWWVYTTKWLPLCMCIYLVCKQQQHCKNVNKYSLYFYFTHDSMYSNTYVLVVVLNSQTQC